MLRILTLTRYQRLGSSSRVRFYQYFPYLESNSLSLSNASFFTDEYVHALYNGRKITIKDVVFAYIKRLNVLLESGQYKLLWAEKEFLPWFPFIIESLFKTKKVPFVVDYDDAVFHRYNMHPNPLIRGVLGNKIDKVMKHAEIVIAGNEYIAEKARKAGAHNIEILPSVVDVSRYKVKEWDENKVFKIGWIGSPVTAPFLDMIYDVVYKMYKESEIRLILVGVGDKHQLPSVPVENISWSEDIEFSISQKFDVGIMPLPDEPFERGKCGYKLIQYMAGGLPVIASPVGVNRQIVEHGVNGYLAETTNDWLTAFRSLRDDPKKRQALGNAGRKKAERLYNLSVTAPKLLEILKRAAKK